MRRTDLLFSNIILVFFNRYFFTQNRKMNLDKKCFDLFYLTEFTAGGKMQFWTLFNFLSFCKVMLLS